MEASKPTFTIFAGINGSGKTTLYRFYNNLAVEQLGTRVCADEILESFNGDWRSSRDKVLSGRITIDQLDSCLENGETFNWETTVIGTHAINLVEKAKSYGYKVNIYFIGVEDPELSIKRIAHRVEKGGHDIRNEVVIARHKHQCRFMNQMFPIVDNILFFDNEDAVRIVGTYVDKKLNFYCKDKQWINNMIDQYNKSLQQDKPAEPGEKE